MTILIGYHISGEKCFNYYYQTQILGYLLSYFPKAPTYSRFVTLAQKANMPIALLMLHLAIMAGKKHEHFFINSTKLLVCDNRRIYQNKVFKGIAQRGKTSMGWFYGMKLYLIINSLGEICAFALTPGNVADNSTLVVPTLCSILQGMMYGDAGYISASLQEKLFNMGVTLLTKIRSNMKNKFLTMKDKIMLKKRTIVETVIGLLKFIQNISHTRHRSPANFLNNLLGGLLAYSFLDRKPTLKFYQKNKFELFLDTIQN